MFGIHQDNKNIEVLFLFIIKMYSEPLLHMILQIKNHINLYNIGFHN